MHLATFATAFGTSAGSTWQKWGQSRDQASVKALGRASPGLGFGVLACGWALVVAQSVARPVLHVVGLFAFVLLLGQNIFNCFLILFLAFGPLYMYFHNNPAKQIKHQNLWN